MNRVSRRRTCLPLVLTAVAATAALCLATRSGAQSPTPLVSPIITPLTPLPFAVTPPPPTATPQVAEVEIALRYATDKLSIPADRLLLAGVEPREFRELGRAVTVVDLVDSASSRSWVLLVDRADHSVVEGRQALDSLQAAEADARVARYGKLQPDLYARLQKATDDELIPVAITAGSPPKHSQRELFAALAAQFPKAQAALDQGAGAPWDVPDAAVAASVREAYQAMVVADVQPLVQPLVAALQDRGYAAGTTATLPAVTAHLPKPFILELGQRSDVGTIFLIEQKEGLASDIAIPSDRVPALWRQGLDGTVITNPIKIAVIENGMADFTSAGACANNCFRHVGEAIPGDLGSGDNNERDHATLVASIAASDQAQYKGVAPGVTIYSAGTNGVVEQYPGKLHTPSAHGRSISSTHLSRAHVSRTI